MDTLYNINLFYGIKFRRRTSIPTFWLAIVHNSLMTRKVEILVNVDS